MDEKAYLTDFLVTSATEALVAGFQKAVQHAAESSTGTQLAHIVLSLLDDATVGERIPPDVESRTRAELARQLLELPVNRQDAGILGFALSPLVEPARSLARDWGAPKVSPLTFLATCLSAEVSADPLSVRTAEILRSCGITVEVLGARVGKPDARRQDFTFKSLGFGSDVTAMARAGFWAACPLVGMEPQLRILAKLLNSGTGSACIVGEPGVGKSAFIQGLAWRIAAKDRAQIPENMDAWTIVMIEAADLVRGTSARGELENRIRDMISFFTQNPTVIPFFDEMHRLLDMEDPSAKAVGTALKPPMANGQFRCVGCTTDKEYARYIASDEAMSSRFQKVLLPEPDKETARRILEGSKANMLRGRAQSLGVEIGSDAISTAVDVTVTYNRAERLPRKAINLLNAVVSEKVYELDMPSGASVHKVIGSRDVARFFSEISGIPVDALDADRPAYYRRLRGELGGRVKGQPQAIDAVVSHLALHARGWLDQRRPRGRFLFLGPPGVGKTELALSLAAEVMRDRGSLIVLNMADFQGEGARTKFLGADPGYIGYGQTPTIYSRVMMRPFSVVVLDEFEKSDPSLADPLLSILDGWGEDSQGRKVDFSQCIFVMTSNALVGDPKSPVASALWERLDQLPAASDEKIRIELREKIDEEMRRLLWKTGEIWTLPLLDRLDRVCLFRPLGEAALLDILDALIKKRIEQASHPLPAELGDMDVRRRILSEATFGDDSASARRLERALLRWLCARSETKEAMPSEIMASSADGSDWRLSMGQGD